APARRLSLLRGGEQHAALRRYLRELATAGANHRLCWREGRAAQGHSVNHGRENPSMVPIVSARTLKENAPL
ncbi:MAG TPA: hypothetical protein VNI78_08890, partial [Vicinamibacterales bacterium]|nr:hypothetical protein [Vicinamibacterales bacterium]